MFPGDFFSEFNGCKQALFTESSHQAPVYEPLNSRVESIIINCYGWKICTNFCHFCYFCVCFSTPLGRVTLSCFIWCLPSLLSVGICLTHWLDKRISRRVGLFGLASQRCSLHWWWDHEGLCSVQLTVHSQSRSRVRWTPLLRSLSCFYSVSSRPETMGWCPIYSGSSYLSYLNIEKYPHTCSATCFHRNSKLHQVDN